MCFFFSDMIMTARQGKLKKGYQLDKVFYYSQCLVRDGLQHQQQQNLIEILDTDSRKIYKFALRSEEEKDELLKFLRDAIYTQTFTWTEDRSILFHWFYDTLLGLLYFLFLFLFSYAKQPKTRCGTWLYATEISTLPRNFLRYSKTKCQQM